MMRKYLIITATVAMATLLVCRAEAKVVYEHISILKAGDVDKKTIDAIKSALVEQMPMPSDADIGPDEKLPDSAYDSSRKQYNAETAIADIAKRQYLDKRVESVLIVTDADIYAKNRDFVFGAADASKVTAIISTARLKNEFYGLKPDNKRFLERVVKEAVREVAAALGLPDCSDKKCLMYPSNAVTDIDNKKKFLCHRCHNDLRNKFGGPLLNVQLPVLK